jgi:hypothetical protein
LDVDRQIAQHRARIATLKRDAVIGGVTLAVLLALVACAFGFEWHPLIKALLVVPTLGMLFHSAAPYTRMSEHRRKLRELEDLKGSDRAQLLPNNSLKRTRDK